jgi:hypothetical protein
LGGIRTQKTGTMFSSALNVMREKITDTAGALGCLTIQRGGIPHAEAASWGRLSVATGPPANVAAELNRRGVRTPRGIGPWQAGSVAQFAGRLPG